MFDVTTYAQVDTKDYFLKDQTSIRFKFLFSKIYKGLKSKKNWYNIFS